MKKTELINRFKGPGPNPKNFYTKTEVARCLGTGKEFASDLLRETDYIMTSRSKLYFVDDIAEAIIRRKAIG